MPPHNSDLGSYLRPAWSLSRIPPMELLSIASYLNKNEHKINIVDCRELITNNKTDDYISLLQARIEHSHPDVIGINMLTANFNHVKAIADKMKSTYPHITIIAGGVHPSVEPELTFKQVPSIDAICIGAGEEVCLDIANDKKLEDINGLMTRDGNYTKRKPELNIDKYPFPDYTLVNKDYYTYFSANTVTGWGFKGISALTSRSCPYSCKFCASDWSKPVRFHSAEYVVRLVKYLSTFDIDSISFFDDTIALKESRLFEMCEGFIKERIFYPNTKLRWTGSMRSNQVNPGLLQRIKKAGCYNIAIGFESGSDRMLEVVNKKVTVEQNRQACDYVKEAGLHLSLSFMMGIPSETEDDMRATISFMKEVNCNYTGLCLFRPLPGSPFFHELIESSMDKGQVDWVNLGNILVTPKYLFCDAPRPVFEKLFDEAYNYAKGRQSLSIHGDVARKYPKLVKEITTNVRTNICESDNFSVISLVPYRLSSPKLALQNIAESTYIHLPYILRKLVRATAKRILRVRLFHRWFWKYDTGY